MKSKAIMMMIIMVLMAGLQRSFAQGRNEDIRSVPVSLAWEKTTNLLFPYSIKSVDRGSRDVLVQKARGVDNVLQLKAGKRNFKETNLTVITADGKLYSFLLGYSQYPTLNLQVDARTSSSQTLVQFTSPNDLEAVITDAACQVAERKATMNRQCYQYDVRLALTGIYVRNDVLYFRIKLENNTRINYDIGQLRFYIRDKKIIKRTASQEVEQQPILIHGNSRVIRGMSEQVVVVTLKKFTIPDKKYLVLQLMEAGGGRHLSLTVPNRQILKAEAL
jgi:conjugative transposon TraN protein